MVEVESVMSIISRVIFIQYGPNVFVVTDDRYSTSKCELHFTWAWQHRLFTAESRWQSESNTYSWALDDLPQSWRDYDR